jgi:AraC-like DNA-binding protein
MPQLDGGGSDGGNDRMAFGGPHYGPENRIMMSCDRMAFGGPQVQLEQFLGGYVMYISVARPFLLTIDNVWSERRFVAVVPPYTKHRVAGPRSLRSILVEAETVPPSLLQDERVRLGGKRAAAWAARIEEGFQRWQAGAYDPDRDSFDLFFFGERLPYRNLDKRVALAVDHIRSSTDGWQTTTSAIAKDVTLSPSRLRHLFCEQVGVPIRSFRAWKRFRNAIQIALQESNILKLAMAAGYADATHFCHSMKLYCGEQPTWVCAHWRTATFVHADKSEHEPLPRAANDRTRRSSVLDGALMACSHDRDEV